MFKTKNPFITSAAVYRDNHFFNREEVLNSVKYFVEQSNDYNFLLYGQRRIGKTSILKKINYIYNNDKYISIYKNLQGDAEKSLTNLLSEIKDIIISKIKLENYSIKITEHNFLSKFLYDIKNKLNNVKLILLFDEFDVLGERENIEELKKRYSFHQFVNYIPKIIETIEENEIPIKLIFTIGRNYKDLADERFGQINKFGRQKEINHFDKKTVSNLLKISDKIIPFTKQAIEHVYKTTNGQPYFTQCLANVSFQRAEKNNYKEISKDLVEKCILPTIKNYRSGVHWIWNTLTAKDKIILYLISELKENKKNVNTASIKDLALKKAFLPFTKDLDTTIARLINIDFIIINNHSNFEFKAEFFRKWIYTQVTYNELKKYFNNFDTEIKKLFINARFFINEEKNYIQAAKYFDEILKYDNNNKEAQFYKAKCLTFNNNLTENEYDIIFKLFKISYNPNDKNKKEFIANFLFDNYTKKNNTEIVTFLKKVAPKDFENKIWQETTTTNDIQGYNNYLTLFPNGEYSKEAVTKIDKLYNIKIENYKLENEVLIFTFGATGSGKSTLLAGLFNSIKTNNYAIAFDSIYGKNVFKNYSKELYLENRFPQATPLIETSDNLPIIKFLIERDDMKNVVLSFTEFAGEDLEELYPDMRQIMQEVLRLKNNSKKQNQHNKIEKSNIINTNPKEYKIRFGNVIDNMIKQNSPTIFLLTASYEYADIEDSFINIFISYLRNHKSPDDIIGISVIVTMWDLNEKAEKPYANLYDFMRDKMPMTFNYLKFFNAKGLNATGFNFSIGKVNDNNSQKIMEFDFNYSQKVLDWILKFHKVKKQNLWQKYISKYW